MSLLRETSQPSPGARRDWSDLAEATAPHARGLSDLARRTLDPILRDDVLTEYDAGFLSAHLHGLGLDFSPEFLAAEERWRVDEERHFSHTLEVYRAHWDWAPDELEGRRPDFAPLEPLFGDELSILCLLAYDELATVRAYRANLPWYAQLGPEYLRWARALVADEAWHYAAFLEVILTVHREDLARTPGLLDKVVAREGTPYAATFVLDHDDPVFTSAMLADAERVLRRRLNAAISTESRGFPSS